MTNAFALSADLLLDALKAAGEATRLRILALLLGEELSVMELARILDQSQPRVSRHLKLLTEAGLIERFPDGAWVFYRAVGTGARRKLLDDILARLDPAELARDYAALGDIHQERADAASNYFERNAARWDELRALYVAEDQVEAAIIAAAGPGPYEQLVDLGAGSGRMLTLLGPNARAAVGLDLSQNMLNIARTRVREAGLSHVDLRHGDIFETRLPSQAADLVIVHQVLHYLADPAGAVREAARLVAPGGRLLIVDFAPHTLERLREEHQHRRLGFAEDEVRRWMSDAGLVAGAPVILPSGGALSVVIWTAHR